MEIKNTRLYKWLDNYWYHYKWVTIIAALFAVFAIVSTVQLLTNEKGDIYVMYAGPEVISVQNIGYIEKAFENIDEKDYHDDGKINAVLRELTVKSPDELEAEAHTQLEADGVANEGYMLNEQMARSYMSQNLQVFNQEILGGDSVICLLSPYTYSIVHESGGFMTLEEALGYTPDGAYDECAVYLRDTDFGSLEGLAILPEDTLFCIRRLSSMAFLKGQNKTEAAHRYHLEKFGSAIAYRKNEDLTEN